MMLYKQPPGPHDGDNPVRIAFGAPCPVEIWEEFESRFGMKLVEVYGMTEAPMACENRLDNRKIGSAGRESMTYEVRIVDEHDEPVPPDTPGEIVVRPKLPGAIFSGYYGREADTVEAWRNLWFHTGDRGTMDEDGFLFFLDRMKDCIRRRGENISSWEVESTINTHESVLESAAYGVASELSESDVMVAVVLRPNASLRPDELLDFCQGRMAHFAVPRYVRFVDALPKNASERIEKFRLREAGVTADTWDRELVGYTVRR
jgi:crotonobetaine/carnitine-CoA ligase